jgi:hypothetical protein
MTFPDFPSLITSPAITRATTFKIPEDDWVDPAAFTFMDDQQSVEVQSTGSDGFWGALTVIIQAPEADADIIFSFLRAQRLSAVPFWFTHRKRLRILVRYWPFGTSAPSSTPPMLPYKRAVSGRPDQIEFVLSLRQEGGTS